MRVNGVGAEWLVRNSIRFCQSQFSWRQCREHVEPPGTLLLIRSIRTAMSRLNWRRIVLAGLSAGLIVNMLQIVWSGVILGRQWQEAVQALNRQVPSHAVWIFAAESFGIGIASVWLYAVMRSHFGPGPQTAMLAGLAYWIIGYALPAIGIAQMGVFPSRLLLFTNLGGLGVIVLATLVGASFYRD